MAPDTDEVLEFEAEEKAPGGCSITNYSYANERFVRE